MPLITKNSRSHQWEKSASALFLQYIEEDTRFKKFSAGTSSLAHLFIVITVILILILYYLINCPLYISTFSYFGISATFTSLAWPWEHHFSVDLINYYFFSFRRFQVSLSYPPFNREQRFNQVEHMEFTWVRNLARMYVGSFFRISLSIDSVRFVVSVLLLTLKSLFAFTNFSF